MLSPPQDPEASTTSFQLLDGDMWRPEFPFQDAPLSFYIVCLKKQGRCLPPRLRIIDHMDWLLLPSAIQSFINLTYGYKILPSQITAAPLLNLCNEFLLTLSMNL